jgi:glycosyltransferase involved in cell wall biosynthesis
VTYKKTKVLHLIKSLGRGGAETLLPETLKLHDHSKFEFHYIYFLPWKNQLVEAIQQNGGKVTCLSASNNLLILFKVRSLIRYIREHQIQVVHCHLPWAGIDGRLVFRLADVPVIYTEHNKQERYHFLTRMMNRITFNWQSAVVAVSKDVADSIRKNISSDVPVYEILNGVNTITFQRDIEEGKRMRQKLSIPDDAIVVGTVAVFRFQKRLMEWLEVFAEASAKQPRLVGIIVGDGPLRGEVEEHRKKLGLGNKVHLAGLQTDVKPWYNAIDIFMMTSIFEGLPIAMLEAMSMECAIATTDAGGIKEVIRHEADGLMVNVMEWEKLSVEIIKLTDDKELRSRLARAARQRVVEEFSLRRMVGELEELYCLTAESRERKVNS